MIRERASASPEELPAEIRQLDGLKPWWYLTATLLLVASALHKPWNHIDVKRSGPPTNAETERLLRPYSLVIEIAYKDIYRQPGRTTYRAVDASGAPGIELVELFAPSVELGAVVKPIAFSRGSP